MYIQITSRCNMSCLHCGSNCTAVGEDMSFEVFKESCVLSQKYQYTIVIGGGEPTLHKDFEKFLSYTLDNSFGLPGLVTNGTNKTQALFLAELAKEGIIWCALSVDKYHDLSKVSPEVIRAFKKGLNNKVDRRELRNIHDHVHLVGRAIESHRQGLLHHRVKDDGCLYGGLEIDPLGKIYHCNCKTVCYGSVFNNTIPKNYYRVKSTCDTRDTNWRDYLVGNEDESWGKQSPR